MPHLAHRLRSDDSAPDPSRFRPRFLLGALALCLLPTLSATAEGPTVDSTIDPTGDGTVEVVSVSAERLAALQQETQQLETQRQETQQLEDGRRQAGGMGYAGFGLWIFMDPETGEIVPPSPEQQARRRAVTAKSLAKSDAGLEPFSLETGGRGVYLEGRFQHALRAQMDADGNITYVCSDHPDGHGTDGHDHEPVESTPAPPKAVLQ